MNPDLQTFTSTVPNGTGTAMANQNGGSPRTSQETSLGPPPPPPRNGTSSIPDLPGQQQEIIYISDDYLHEHHQQQPAPTRRRHVFPTYYTATLPLRNRRLVPKYRIRCLEVVCLLYSAGNVFRVPRGANRTHLASQHLTGKIDVTASMTQKEVGDKVASVFWRIFQLDCPERFTFTYLSLMPNSKRLQKPSLSASFKWNGKEVIRIANRNKLYIMASREIMPQMDGLEPHSETESSLVISGSEENTVSRLGALESGENCASMPRVCEVLPHFTTRGNSHEAPFPVSLTASDRLNLELNPELSRLCATSEIDESSTTSSQSWKLWSHNELLALLDIWENPVIRSKVANVKCDGLVFDNMSRLMASRGFTRSGQHIREKVFSLRRAHLSLSNNVRDELEGNKLRLYQRMEAILRTSPSEESVSSNRQYSQGTTRTAFANYSEEEVVMADPDDHEDEDNKDSLRALLNLNAADTHLQPSTSTSSMSQHHHFVASGSVLDTAAHPPPPPPPPMTSGELYRDCSANHERSFSSMEQMVSQLIDRFIDSHEQSEIRFLAAEEKRAEDERNHFAKQCRHDKEMMQTIVDLEERRGVQDREHESRMWQMFASHLANAGGGNRSGDSGNGNAPLSNAMPNWEFTGVFRPAASEPKTAAASSSSSSSNEK